MKVMSYHESSAAKKQSRMYRYSGGPNEAPMLIRDSKELLRFNLIPQGRVMMWRIGYPPGSSLVRLIDVDKNLLHGDIPQHLLA